MQSSDNLAFAERIVRVFLGVVLLCAFALTTSGIFLWAGIAISAIIALTGAVGYCPAYGLLGINTKEPSGS
jgi:hypothetical protein